MDLTAMTGRHNGGKMKIDFDKIVEIKLRWLVFGTLALMVVCLGIGKAL